MYRAFSAGAIKIKIEFAQTVALAKKYEFAGVEIGLREIAELGLTKAKAMLSEAGLRVAGCHLPVNYKEDEAAYQRDLAEFPRFVEIAAAIGCDRVNTFIWPCSETLTFKQNFHHHVNRLRPVAQLLADHGARFGLEFLGPRSIRKGARYDFIYNMDAMLALAAALGDNTGLLLDCWHWQMAGHSVADLTKLQDSDIVYVHVNDAPPGLSSEEVVDTERFLPGETGVLDLAGFMGALEQIGYTGPVIVEPFSARLKALSPEQAVKETADSLAKIWRW